MEDSRKMKRRDKKRKVPTISKGDVDSLVELVKSDAVAQVPKKVFSIFAKVSEKNNASSRAPVYLRMNSDDTNKFKKESFSQHTKIKEGTAFSIQ
uniref:SWIB domain-containing protein n=1 Tax=Rhabditophanes sp. KR3021 TaxID=114890 RepID=A0AC35U8F8_9BILA